MNPANEASRTRIKICGLTRAQDVRAACALGADAVGFVCFAGSPRYVLPERLGELAACVAPFVTPVLLFVDAPHDLVRAAIARVPAAVLQFHGGEDPARCASFGRPYLRAAAMEPGVDLVEYGSRFATAAGLLADAPPATGTAAAGGFGGTGQTFPWERLPEPRRRTLPLILAGGLRADNVALAIRTVRPYAVDVSSGVEAARGIKSVERMRDFIGAVRAADAAFEVVHGGAA